MATGRSTLVDRQTRDSFSRPSPADDGSFDLTLDGMKSRVVAVIEGHELYLRTRNGRFDLHWVDPFGGETEEQVGEDKIVAPLPGTVVALLAEEGATLEKGAAILTLEVMKMEQTLRAPFAGVLKKIKCKVGDIVGEGVELAEIEPAAACMSDTRPHRRSRPARRAAEREDAGQRRRPDRLHRGADRRRAPYRRGRRLRLAQGDPADGRIRPRCCAASAISRPANSPCWCRTRRAMRPRSRRRQGDRGVCRGVGRLFARQYQLLDCGIDRALQAGAGAAPRPTASGCAAMSPPCSAVPMRARSSRRRSSMSRRCCGTSAATKSRSATPSASARR